MLCNRCHKQEAPEGGRNCQSCRDKRQSLYRKNPLKYREKTYKWLERHREYYKEVRRKAQQDKRRLCILKYGGKCTCCGLEHLPYLQLDHVNGNGHRERKQGKLGMRFYNHLLREPVSPDLQVLCANCHHAKTRKEECLPH
jgi:hypothetical protein